MVPGIREEGHAPAAAQGPHLGGVSVDQGGGAAVEGVEIGALEEFRGELPGIEGNAFHAHSMGGSIRPQGRVRDVKGGSPEVSFHTLIFQQPKKVIVDPVIQKPTFLNDS